MAKKEPKYSNYTYNLYGKTTRMTVQEAKALGLADNWSKKKSKTKAMSMKNTNSKTVSVRRKGKQGSKGK